MEEDTVKITSELVDTLVQYTNNLDKLIEFNTGKINDLYEFGQNLGLFVVDLANLVTNNMNTIAGGLGSLNDRYDLVELMQNAQEGVLLAHGEVITSLLGMLKVSLLTGIWNTASIVAIIAYLIFNRKK